MKREFVLLGSLALAACLPARAKDLRACQTEADQFYQTYQAIDADDPRSRYIIGCMAAKGYDLDVSPVESDGNHRLVTQSACYTPESRIARFIDQFRIH